MTQLKIQPPIIADEKLAYTYRDAAKLIAVSERTVWQLVRDRHLAAVTIGRRSKRITRAEIERFLLAATSK